MRIVIVGGVAGGMSAATRLRRLDESAEIIVFERSGHVSFANCGLPYHVSGVIPRRQSLLLQTPASLHARFELDVCVHHEVTAIDPAARTVEVKNLDAGTTETVSYDALVLSPGAKALTPPIPGIERALTLRNVEDVDAMVAALQSETVPGTLPAEDPGVEQGSVVVIGGGFIGLEVAENMVHAGRQVALVEGTDQVMPPLDLEMVSPVHGRLRANGVDLHLGHSVTVIGEHDVTLDDGTRLPAEIVVAAIGVRPEDSLARAAGLEVAERGGIVIDDQYRTSDPFIYAVGDAVVKADAIDDSDVLIALAQTANLQGRRVADVIMGRAAFDRPVLGTAIVGVFGLQVASTGWSEKRARALGRRVRVIHTHPADHAGYYPGATPLALKLVVDEATDAILGAQVVGEKGADKRIDVIATAISGGITATELAELELAYAPAFGSAKDPVNFLGYIDANLSDVLVDSIQWHEVDEAVATGAHVLDVRTAGEHERLSIPGSTLIPLDELRSRIEEARALAADGGDLVVHCAVGLRGYLACRILAQHGISARNLDGGITTWNAGQAALAR